VQKLPDSEDRGCALSAVYALKATGRRVELIDQNARIEDELTETPEGIVKGEPLGHCSNERGVYLIHGRQLVCVGELHLKSVDCSQQRLDGFLETPPGSFESSKFIRECRIIAEAEKLCSVTIPNVMVGVVWRQITKPIHHVFSKILVLTVRQAGRRR